MVDCVSNTLRLKATVLIMVALPLLSYPLIWMPQSWAQFRFSVALPIGVIVCVALMIGVVVGVVKGRLTVGSSTLLWPALCLMISWLISIRVSRHPHFSLAALALPLGGLAVGLLATQFPRDHLRRLCWWWLAAAIVVALLGLGRLRVEQEFLSTIGNRNFLAAYLAASILVGLALWDKRAALACVPLLAAMYCCHSRGAWLALGAALIVWLPCRVATTARWQMLLGIGAGILILAVGAYVVLSHLADPVRQDVRPAIWAGTWNMIKARPLVGHGLGTFVVEFARFRPPEYFTLPKAGNLTDHAHCELLETAAEQGLLGLAVTLWLWGAVLWRGVRAGRADAADRSLLAGLLGATVVFLAHGLVDIDLRFLPNQALLWFLLGLLAGAVQDRPVRISVAEPITKWLVAVVLIVGACLVAYAGVIQPVQADWWERQARLAEGRASTARARGDTPVMLREFQQAADAASRALDLQPFRLPTRYLLAQVLVQTPTAQAQSRALEQCLQIEELAPDYADITFNLGQLYLTQRRYADALPYLQRATRINPYSADKRVQLAYCYNALGQRDPALRELQEALHLDPKHRQAQSMFMDLQRPSPP